MKIFYITILLSVLAMHRSMAELPEPVTTLDGTDNIDLLIKGYPKEKYDISRTFCGLKPTPEFREGYMIALRLFHLGVEPYYLIYPEADKLPESYLPIKTLTLTNYKHSAKLLEPIRGFNFSMADRAYEAQFINSQKRYNKPEIANPR